MSRQTKTFRKFHRFRPIEPVFPSKLRSVHPLINPAIHLRNNFGDCPTPRPPFPLERRKGSFNRDFEKFVFNESWRRAEPQFCRGFSGLGRLKFRSSTEKLFFVPRLTPRPQNRGWGLSRGKGSPTSQLSIQFTLYSFVIPSRRRFLPRRWSWAERGRRFLGRRRCIALISVESFSGGAVPPRNSSLFTLSGRVDIQIEAVLALVSQVG